MQNLFIIYEEMLLYSLFFLFIETEVVIKIVSTKNKTQISWHEEEYVKADIYYHK